MNEVHMNKRYYKCEFCDKDFKRKYDLQIHAQNSHENDKSFKCDVCQTTFSDRAKLMVHKTQVHESKIIKSDSECDICKKRFPKSRIDRHMNDVHKESIVNCEMCHKQFGSKRTLAFHMKVCHNENNFKCLLCDKAFRRKSELEYHVENSHENKYKI